MPSSIPNANLLIDGYNIIGAWPFLRDARDRHNLEAARQHLIEALVNYAAFQGYETEIVFDAQYRDAVASREAVTSQVWVYYTDHNQTADTYIEKVCAKFYGQSYRQRQRLIVATSDRAQQLTVKGYGAEWMSATQLLSDVEFSRRRVNQKFLKKQKASKKLLHTTLDPVVQKKLTQMRFGITEQ